MESLNIAVFVCVRDTDKYYWITVWTKLTDFVCGNMYLSLHTMVRLMDNLVKAVNKNGINGIPKSRSRNKQRAKSLKIVKSCSGIFKLSKTNLRNS